MGEMRLGLVYKGSLFLFIFFPSFLGMDRKCGGESGWKWDRQEEVMGMGFKRPFFSFFFIFQLYIFSFFFNFFFS